MSVTIHNNAVFERLIQKLVVALQKELPPRATITLNGVP